MSGGGPGAPPGGDLALEARGLSKHYAGVRALDDVDLLVGRGEIHGLVGQNGSGKSTLIKVLGGVHAPEPGGALRCWGSPVDLPVRRPADHGMAFIHQDLGLCGEMTVLENLGASSRYGARLLGAVAWRRERAVAAALLDGLGIDLDLSAPVGSLSPAERAMVAIARASRVLGERGQHHLFVLDEPTTYLTAAEAGRVTALMRQVAARGDSVVFISHFLPEVLSVCDRVTVLRDGRVAARAEVGGLDERELIALMLGREVQEFYPDRPDWEPGEVVLAVDDLAGLGVEGVSFALRRGEVVGFTGLTGDGHDDLPHLVTGARPRRAGQVRVGGGGGGGGGALAPGVRAALRAGVVAVPADRPRDGAWLEATAAENITLPQLGSYFRRGRVDRRAEAERSAALMDRFLVRPPRPDRVVGSFSGGNQQKVVLAKWLQGEPRVLLLHEPTQGVDAGARHEILALVRERAHQGAACALFSSDHEQLAAVCNRVLVIRHGRVRRELSGPALSEDEILASCHAA